MRTATPISRIYTDERGLTRMHRRSRECLDRWRKKRAPDDKTVVTR